MEFVNKIPNWLRWILIPVVSILAMFIAHWITQFFAGVQSSQVGLESGGFFQAASKQEHMIQNIKNIYTRIPNLSRSEVKTLRGIIVALKR